MDECEGDAAGQPGERKEALESAKEEGTEQIRSLCAGEKVWRDGTGLLKLLLLQLE